MVNVIDNKARLRNILNKTLIKIENLIPCLYRINQVKSRLSELSYHLHGYEKSPCFNDLRNEVIMCDCFSKYGKHFVLLKV